MMPLCLISFSVSRSCLRQYWLLGSMWRHTPGILNILDASNKLTYVDQVCLLHKLGLWARTQSCHWRVWVWGALSIWDSANSADRGIPFILANAIQREAAENKLDPDLLPNLQLENSTWTFFRRKVIKSDHIINQLTAYHDCGRCFFLLTGREFEIPAHNLHIFHSHKLFQLPRFLSSTTNEKKTKNKNDKLKW